MLARAVGSVALAIFGVRYLGSVHGSRAWPSRQDMPKGPPKLKVFDQKPPTPWWMPDGLGDIL